MSRPFDAVSMEVLLHIVESVESKEGLKALARCSRMFHRVTLPVLYEHIYLRLDGTTDSYDIDDYLHSIEPLVRRLRSLTEVLLRKPCYARLVRSLTMRTIFYTEGWDECESLISVALTEEIKTAIHVASHSREEEEEWLTEAGYASNEDALVALLIPALVNLEKLDLTFGHGMKYSSRMLWRARLQEKPFGEAPILQKLTDAMSTLCDLLEGMLPYRTALYFALPVIRRIFLHRIRSDDSDDELDQGLAALKMGSSTVTHLEFKHCKLNRADLKQILSIPRALDTFIYEVGWSATAYCRFSTTAVRDALERQARSLKVLWLDHTENCVEWVEGVDDVTPMASFKNFDSLKRLRIAAVFLFGVHRQNNENRIRPHLTEALSPVLEELHFTHCEACFDTLQTALEPLIIYKDQYVPSLRKIILEGPFTNRRELWKGLARLLRLADTAGIEMTTLDDHSEGPRGSEVRERPWGMDGEFQWADYLDDLNKRPVVEVIEIPHSDIEGSSGKKRRRSS